MKKLILLLLCLTLCNCQLYIDELNRQKGIIKQSEQEKAQMTEKCVDYSEQIENETIRVGMPEDCLLLSWGKPKKINNSCNSRTGCVKQYVYYANHYVYVRNGAVTSWQSR